MKVCARVWLTCAGGGRASEDKLSTAMLFFLTVADATAAADLPPLDQPTMNPKEPTLVAAN